MTLALHGGTPVRTTPFPPRPGIGRAERQAVKEVMGEGVLSGFVAEPGEGFLGGPRVRALEDAWAEAFNVKYAVAMNSATSALYSAMTAMDIFSPEEAIVTPWSMAASVSCVRVVGACPRFADIEPETFGLDPESVMKNIGRRTKAVVVVDLFGCPARLGEISAICKEHGLALIEDASQAPGAIFDGYAAGTIGDIGVFSLNYHKTIQCGEGGIAVTNRDDLAERLRLYRNHGETIVDSWDASGRTIGGNYRMGELEAAIAKVQLDRLAELTVPRVENAQRLTEGIRDLVEDIQILPPAPLQDRTSVYYLYAVRIKEKLPGVFQHALHAEGIPFRRYVEPLWKLPAFKGFAYADDRGHSPSPEADRAYREVFVTPAIHAGMTDDDVDDIIRGFRKVHEHRGDLYG